MLTSQQRNRMWMCQISQLAKSRQSYLPQLTQLFYAGALVLSLQRAKDITGTMFLYYYCIEQESFQGITYIYTFLDSSPTLPYLACHAKKYNSAASGCPTKQNEAQNIMLPTVLPSKPLICCNASVSAISGICSIMPINATPMILCVGIPTSISCNTAENTNTITCANLGGTPRATSGK